MGHQFSGTAPPDPRAPHRTTARTPRRDPLPAYTIAWRCAVVTRRLVKQHQITDDSTQYHTPTASLYRYCWNDSTRQTHQKQQRNAPLPTPHLLMVESTTTHATCTRTRTHTRKQDANTLRGTRTRITFYKQTHYTKTRLTKTGCGFVGYAGHQLA